MKPVDMSSNIVLVHILL